MSENKSVFNWTFCQLLYSRKNPIVRNYHCSVANQASLSAQTHPPCQSSMLQKLTYICAGKCHQNVKEQWLYLPWLLGHHFCCPATQGAEGNGTTVTVGDILSDETFPIETSDFSCQPDSTRNERTG
jgi:hypothetical protein